MGFRHGGGPALLGDLALALRFFSRLPVPSLPGETDAFGAPPLPRIAYAVPVAGAVLGLLGGLVMVAGHLLKLPPFLACSFAVAALVFATGAFHEDGLADTADGLGGGRDREHKLAILRDSRIGTFGGCALVLSLMMRVGALEALLASAGPLRALLALVAAEAGSRTAGLLLLQSLPPARTDGAGASAGVPGPDGITACLLVAAGLVATCVIPAFGVTATFMALFAPIASWLFFHSLARRHIGGQTGDVAGAAQQVAVIAILTVILIFGK